MEEKIKFPLRYIIMGLSLILLLVVYLLTRKSGFFNYVAFAVSSYYCVKSVSLNADYEKWSVFWFFYAIVEMMTLHFRDNIYVSVVKCGVIIYFAVFDSCSILIDGLKKVYSLVERGVEWYMQFCKGKSE